MSMSQSSLMSELSQAASKPQSALNVRIVTVDHCMVAPSRFDDADKSTGTYDHVKYPVIRVFGVTERGKCYETLWSRWLPLNRYFGNCVAGQKVCVHVHGVFPYFCVPFNQQYYIDKAAFLKKLANELDDKLCPPQNLRNYRPQNRRSSSIHKIDIIKGMWVCNWTMYSHSNLIFAVRSTAFTTWMRHSQRFRSTIRSTPKSTSYNFAASFAVSLYDLTLHSS